MKLIGTVFPFIGARVYTSDGWYIGTCFDAPNPIKDLLASVGESRGYSVAKYPNFAEQRTEWTIKADGNIYPAARE